MKHLLMVLTVLFVSVQVAYGYTGEITGTVGIYKNKTIALNEKPTKTLEKGDQVEVTKTSGNRCKVKDYSGATGWIDKSKVRKAQKIGSSTKLSFDGENIMGELGEIEGVFLFEDDNSVSKGLKVERSFKKEMNAPEDKENLERKHTEYIKW